MAWTDYLADRSGSYAFLVHIEGCPRVFVTKAPLTAAGGAYPAPVDQYGNTFAVSEVLSVAEGVDPSKGEWKREEAIAGGGDFKIRLLADSTIRALFATRATATARSRVTVDCDHNDTSFTVEDGTAMPAPGGGWATAYRGRETFQYDQVVGNVLGGAGHIRRGVYGWQSDSILARRHVVNEGVATRAIYATDHIETWTGRRLTLVRLPLDERGYALATTWQGGTEIQTGWIQPSGGYSSDWGTYEIVCNDLTYALTDYEIGRKQLSAKIAASTDDAGIYIDSGGAWFLLEYAITGATANRTRYVVTADGTASGTVVAGYQSAQYLAQQFALRIETIINTAAANAVDISAEWSLEPNVAGTADEGWVALAWKNGSVPVDGWAIVNVIALEGAIHKYLPGFGGELFMEWISAAGAGGGLQTGFIFGQIPLNTTIPADATTLVAMQVADGAGVPATPPTSGLVKISNGTTVEVASYTGTSVATGPAASYLLTGCTRGLVGTEPVAWASGYDRAGNYLGDEVTFAFCAGWNDTNLGTIALQVLLSTGTAGAYDATYDAQPYGLAIDPACIDVNGIYAALSRVYRTGLVEDAITFEELVKDVALLYGVAFVVETGSDGRRKLTCKTYGDPLAAQYAIAPAFSTADGTILLKPQPELKCAHTKMIDRVTAKLTRFNAGAPVTDEFVVVDQTREEDQGGGRTVTVNAWGFVGDARAAVTQGATRLFGLYAPDEYEVEFATTAAGQKVKLGELITVTIAGIPNPEGTLGLTDRPCVVRYVEPHWFDNGTRPGAIIRAMLKAFTRGWAPSYKITVYDAGPPITVTLADNEFSQAGDINPMGLSPTKDWHFGPASGESFKVYVYEDGDEGNRQACVATYASAGTWTLDTDVAAVGGFGAAPYYAVFQPWGTAGRDSKQGDYAHVADSTKLLGVADSPHYWTT